MASCVGLRSSPGVLGNLSGGAMVTPPHTVGLLGSARVRVVSWGLLIGPDSKQGHTGVLLQVRSHLSNGM